jgi:hypothetical protein
VAPDGAAYLREKQRQCQVAARSTTLKSTVEVILQMAAEFGAKAEAAEAMERASAAVPVDVGPT